MSIQHGGARLDDVRHGGVIPGLDTQFDDQCGAKLLEQVPHGAAGGVALTFLSADCGVEAWSMRSSLVTGSSMATRAAREWIEAIPIASSTDSVARVITMGIPGDHPYCDRCALPSRVARKSATLRAA